MAFYSGFFNAKGMDRVYTAEDFTGYLASIICDGILDSYGMTFSLTSADRGLTVKLGTGKAWIDGHYFLSDAVYSIDLSSYVDESLPRFVAICIVCDTNENVRSVRLELVSGTPAEYPAVPEMPSGDGIKSLLLHAVWLGAGTKSLSKENLIDYRDDDKKCGYCRCILGKCKVTDMLAQLVVLNAQIDKYNETMEGLNNKIDTLQLKIDDMTGDIVKVGQCGDDIYYVLYSDGKLLLRGTGEMYDYGTAIPISDCQYPDIDGDGRVTASDSSLILAAAANIGSGRESGLTPEQEVLADVNRDGKINAIDASLVLNFAASVGAGNYQGSLEGWIDFLNDQRASDNLSPFFDNQNIKSLVVSEGITSLGTFAFNYCNQLSSASLPKTLTKIGRNAFAALATDVYGLTEISIPKKVTEIGSYAFANTQITSLTIPRSVTAVGDYVCSECVNLATVRYEGAVIGTYMFMGCTALANFTLAKSVKEIQPYAFYSCNKLKTLNYEGSLKDWAAVTKANHWDSSANLTKIQCLDGFMAWDSENKEWKVGE
ncbi:MAG: leucine-rich repeat protein [Oscillospiraceae bacterium]